MTNTFLILLLIIITVLLFVSRTRLEYLLKKIPEMNIYLFIGGLVFLFCVVPLLVFFAPSFYYRQDRIAERKAVDTRYIGFYEALSNEDYQTAFTYMLPYYQRTHTLEEFKRDMNRIDDELATFEQERCIDVLNNSAKLSSCETGFLWSRKGFVIELWKQDGEWYLTESYYWAGDW
jgi:hypothetical protein